MIRIDVKEYCPSCMDFNPDVIKPEKIYGGDGNFIWSDTIVQCKYRKRCAAIKRYLENQAKAEVSG